MSELKRVISLPLLTFYGLGTIVGAGIYVLTGEVAGMAREFAPWAFLLAAIIALPTGLSYAEWSSRLPKSAGEAAYVSAAYGIPQLSLAIGIGVILTGIVSAATLANGFVGYFQEFFAWSDWLIVTFLVAGMGALAAWGVRQSVWTATVITILEIGGLLFVLGMLGFFGEPTLSAPPQALTPPPPRGDSHLWIGIAQAAFLAFYAFIGFEDMVNMAEEVHEPRRNVPRAIILALAISTVLYTATAWMAVSHMPPEALAASKAPMALLMQAHGQWAVSAITLISLVAVVNGALVQIIMASRVLYGLAQQGALPEKLGAVSAQTGTPVLATLLVTIGVLALALWFPLVTLAKATSAIILAVFIAINLALLRIKRIEPALQAPFQVPALVPITGIVLSATLLGIQCSRWVMG